MKNPIFPIAVAILLLLGLSIFFGCYYVVQPGEVGVKITLGKMADAYLPPGIAFKAPFISEIRTVNVRQDTQEVAATCFSSDLQQINIRLKILYRIPPASAVSVLRDYSANPFEKLILPRVQESIKEVTALKTAQDIVKTREQIKLTALESSRKKVGTFLTLEDLVIEDVALSPDLERAIEQKMVQQQEAEKAVFKKDQAETDAETVIIRAKGEAEAIRTQGEALQKNPTLIQYRMVEKWNGVSPQVVGAGTSIMLPLLPPSATPAPTP